MTIPTRYAGGAIAFTATYDSNGEYSTSEPSTCMILDTVFRDAFEE